MLEEIAVLVKAGDFAMNWTLRHDMLNIIQDGDGIKEETAKVESTSDMDMPSPNIGSGPDDDDGDEDDFEDVSMDTTGAN